MKIHLQKWGNDLGLRIPSHLAKKLQLRSGSIVNFDVEKGKLVIHVKKYSLKIILSEITPQNQHHFSFDDHMKGDEIW